MKIIFYLIFFLFSVMATLSIKAPNLNLIHTDAWVIIRGILAIVTLTLAILILLKKIKI